MKKSLGIYIHIPFCIKKCGYCDFCSFVGASGSKKSAYADELCARMRRVSSKAREHEVDTVYFGGGTPTLLEISDVRKILDCVRESFEVLPDAEITLECNPATAEEAYFVELRKMGVNRLSIGLQSADENELRALGRVHTAKEFSACFADARSAGFDNISADLMYGIPHQDMQSLARSIEFLLSHSPEHISAYGLTIEEGTDFYRRKRSLCVADADTQADMYCLLDAMLASAGYDKYEISNFARRGYESRHNLRYWQGEEYLGFGVAAHSYFLGERYGNSRDIDAFLRGEDICEERREISDGERRLEYVMLGLRLVRGIDALEYKDLFGRDFFDDFDIEKYTLGGFMQIVDGRVCFTEKGFLVSNEILSEILG